MTSIPTYIRPEDAAAIKLEDGATYVNGYGEKHTIEGPTERYPQYVYSRQGEWFDRETGRCVRYDPRTDTYSLIDAFTWRDLWKRIQR
jgi:hypothetical protein